MVLKIATHRNSAKEILKIRIASFEEKYGMTLKEFEQACKDGRIADPYSYEVENDGWEWDAAVTELRDAEVEQAVK